MNVMLYGNIQEGEFKIKNVEIPIKIYYIISYLEIETALEKEFMLLNLSMLNFNQRNYK